MSLGLPRAEIPTLGTVDIRLHNSLFARGGEGGEGG